MEVDRPNRPKRFWFSRFLQHYPTIRYYTLF